MTGAEHATGTLSVMGQGLRLGVVDDHPAILRGVLALLIELCPEITETFTTSTVAALLGARRSLDLVVLDVRLADGSDPAANVEAVVRAGLPVVLYTQEQRRGVLARCFRAGASGVVDKSEDPAVLASAIREVASGKPYLSSGWAAAVEGADDGLVPDLAPRESEALSLYAAGLPLKSVARRMRVSEDTVKEYLDGARVKYTRVGRPAYTKVDLYQRAVEDGYLPPPGESRSPGVTP
ncbi:MAG: response regulator transcription factor [Candidatus Phosphoribacter baldrii]